MGGRGAKSGYSKSADYDDGYKSAITDDDFYASFAIADYMTKQQMAKAMMDYHNTMGSSLIADLKSDIDSRKQMVKELKATGSMYGQSEEYVNGAIAGERKNIKKREKALKVLGGLRSEYQDAQKEEQKRKTRSKKAGSHWM